MSRTKSLLLGAAFAPVIWILMAAASLIQQALTGQ